MKLYAILAVLAVFSLADCTSYGNNPVAGTPVMEANVDITGSGFEPSTVTIFQGGTVTWRNTGTMDAWPASAVHPTHQEYPGFDANRPLMTGQTYSFTFDKVGTWRYHNHLNPSQTGTVIVVAG